MERVKCNLKHLLEERGISQKQLSEMTEIREATISEMCRDINKTFPRTVMEKIVRALELKDLNQLISIECEK